MTKALVLLFLFTANFAFSERVKILDGRKTLLLCHSLAQEWLYNYNLQEELLHHQGISYRILKGTTERLSSIPIVSIGANPFNREMITIDPEHSPLLETYLQGLRQQIEPDFDQPIKHRLERFSQFVARQVFDRKKSSLAHVEHFLEAWVHAHEKNSEAFATSKFGHQLPVIPLEDFIAEKTGVCRHISLAAAFFLDRLVSSEDNPLIPPGHVYYVRDELPQGGHAWILYLPDENDHIWHIDVYWGQVKDLTHPVDRLELAEVYGEEAIHREIRRFALYRM